MRHEEATRGVARSWAFSIPTRFHLRRLTRAGHCCRPTPNGGHSFGTHTSKEAVGIGVEGAVSISGPLASATRYGARTPGSPLRPFWTVQVALLSIEVVPPTRPAVEGGRSASSASA